MKEQEQKRSRIKERVLWVAEKGTFVTVPLAGYLIATGVVSPVVGIGAILLDIGTYFYLKNRREKPKEQVVFKANPA